MNKNEFIEKVDKEILPAIREQLLEAYGVGYEEGKKEVTLEEYLESHGIPDAMVIDLGLPSGTKWIFPKKKFCFTEVIQNGLQFPTAEQIAEFKKIKLIQQNYSEVDICGLNGSRTKISHHGDGIHFNKCIVMNNMFKISTERFGRGDNWFYPTIYAGDKVYFMFVLPEGVK